MSYRNTKICNIYQTQGFYRVIFFVKMSCMSFRKNVKQRCLFLGNKTIVLTPSLVDESYPCEEQLPPIFYDIAVFPRNLQTKLRVTCRRRQIYTITDETYQPSTDGEAIPNPVGDAPFAGQPPSSWGWKERIGTIADINSIKLESDDSIWSIVWNESKDTAIIRINLEYDDWIWYIVLNESNEI